MRSLAVLALLVVPSIAAAEDTWTNPKPGVRRLHRTTDTQNINVALVNLCAPGVSVRATSSSENQQMVSSFAAAVDAEVAINGDFFLPSFSTFGPAMGDGGGVWGGPDDNVQVPVQFGAHRVLVPPGSSTAGVQPWAEQVVSGHPSLIVGGAVQSFASEANLCDNRHPRTAIGITEDHQTLILAVVDGRAPGRAGFTCTELAALLVELGAYDAANLDGGGSSVLWIKGEGAANFPSAGQERVVGNHLAIHADGRGEPTHCPLPTFVATFVSASAPKELTEGTTATVTLELQNVGHVVWDEHTRVGTRGNASGASALYDPTWLSKTHPVAAVPSVAPSETAMFSWKVRAPAVHEPTTFHEMFQLVLNDGSWFGPKQTIAVTVNPCVKDCNASDGTDASEGGACSTTSTSTYFGLVFSLGVMLRRRRRS